ncbi:hypothetical protein PSZ75_23660, partial [Shigella sonnei]|nr:hypothetical protein [Shigella sonnei]
GEDFNDVFVSCRDNLVLETKVTAVEAKEDGIYVTMEGKKAPAEPQRYDAVLVAIGEDFNDVFVSCRDNLVLETKVTAVE